MTHKIFLSFKYYIQLLRIFNPEALLKYFYRIYWRRLLQISKSLRNINNSNDPYALFRLARKISLIKLGQASTLSNSLIPELTNDKMELHVRQKLFLTISNGAFFKNLVLAIDNPKKRIIIGIPRAWRDVLVEDGYKVQQFLSSILWGFYQIGFFILSIRKSINLIRLSWKRQYFPFKSKYWVLDEIPDNALYVARNKNKGERFFLSKFLSKKMKNLGLGGITLGCVPGNNMRFLTESVIISPEPFIPLDSAWERIAFIFNCLSIMFRGLISWILGDVNAPIATLESIPSAYIRKMRHKNLPSWYISASSVLGYRPTWTLLAEKYGVRIAVAYYSINDKFVQLKNHSLRPEYPSIELMDWPYYLVWDGFQARWIYSLVNNSPKVLELGPIPLLDSCDSIPYIPQGAIAVFDINVARRAHLAKMGVSSIYYSDDIVIKFLLDLYKVIDSFDRVMVLKTKRSKCKVDNAKHRNIIKAFRGKKNVIVINPEINAKRVIDATFATVSIPFVSTGVIAKYMKKPSAFYDPTETIISDDDYTHGVDMLTGVSDLKHWMSKLK